MSDTSFLSGLSRLFFTTEPWKLRHKEQQSKIALPIQADEDNDEIILNH